MGKKDDLFSLDLDVMRGEMEKLFREFFSLKGSFLMFPGNVWRPPTDIFETDKEIIVHLEMAGVRKEDIKVIFRGNTISVKAHRRNPHSGQRISFRQMEIFNGPIERIVRLEEPVDETNIQADCKDGLLAITIPKKGEPQETRVRIETKEGGDVS